MVEKSELLPVLEQIERDKGIKKDDILKMIEQALVSAYKKHSGKMVNLEARIDPDTARSVLDLGRTLREGSVDDLEHPEKVPEDPFAREASDPAASTDSLCSREMV